MGIIQEITLNMARRCCGHRIGNKQKGHSAVQHVPPYLCSLLARVMAELQVWLEPTQ